MASTEGNSGHGGRSGNGESSHRIARQLQALRALIPNSTQTDERSILEDTRRYLQGIYEEMNRLEREVPQGPTDDRPRILHVETEHLAGDKFVVKIGWKRGGTTGGGGHVQRVLESLDLTTTCVTVHQTNPGQMLTTAFVETAQRSISDEDLRRLIMDTAMKMSLLS
uniref:Transcription factor bHLH35 n=1 Tax=Anthurium amnicola TaxID=1678845 RepID=A0A1D1XPI7_9ARAE